MQKKGRKSEEDPRADLVGVWFTANAGIRANVKLIDSWSKKEEASNLAFVFLEHWVMNNGFLLPRR